MYNIVVLFKCEDKNDAPVMAKGLKDLEMLIEQVESFKVELDALGQENSYDFCLIGTFNNYEDYKAYIVHPLHVEYVDKMKELGVTAVKVCFEE